MKDMKTNWGHNRTERPTTALHRLIIMIMCLCAMPCETLRAATPADSTFTVESFRKLPTDVSAFIDAVKRGKRPPIDTYDTAVLMAITPLSEESILKGGAPVVFPDFTGGRWYRRNDIDTESEFCID